MKKWIFPAIFALSVVFVGTSCEKNESSEPISGDVPIVSQFVYDGMSVYYLWNEEMLDKEPTANDTDPETYFKSILYETDTENGWSWITDDVDALLASFEGETKSFGYSLTFVSINEEYTQFLALIKYVYPNTPAANAGIKRLDLIGKVDGEPITGRVDENGFLTLDNDKLNGDKTAIFTIYKLTEDGIVEDKEVQITPTPINTDPVLYDNIYTIGNKKIGYLFYTSYIANYNYRLYEVFSKFKNENITDLVLDLRYNSGGSLSAATYLASFIAPKSDVEQETVFTSLRYNSYLNEYLYKNNISNSYHLGELNEGDQDPLPINLDLDKVYIIATGSSASASELTAFCLKPIMDVVHIGSKTYGKYTASFTIHPYDYNKGSVIVYDESRLSSEEKGTLNNWAMQPIVAVYTDKNGDDFINPGYLQPNYERSEGFGYIDYWTEIGDTKDTLLGQALYLITGEKDYEPVEPSQTRSTKQRHKVVKGLSSLEKEAIKPVLIDNASSKIKEMDKIDRLK